MIERAWQKIALAGREMGSGPAVVVPRIVPNYEAAKQWLTAGLPGLDEVAIGRILLGVAVGLVAAEDPAAMQALTDIERGWIVNNTTKEGSHA